MEQKLIKLLNQVNGEVKNLESKGYTVEITLPNSKYNTAEPKTEVRIYKPFIF